MTNPIVLLAPALDGGIGRNLTNLADGFLRFGQQVDIVLENTEGAHAAQLPDTVTVRRLRTTHSRLGVPGLAAYLMARRPQALITSNVRLTVLALRARGLSASRVRIYANVHNTYSKLYASLGRDKWRRRLAKIRTYYGRCDGVIAVSAGVARDIAQLGGMPVERITTIYNPLNLSLVRQMAEVPVHHPWLSERDRPVIVAVGRLDVAKNFPLLLEAFKQLRSHRQARLLIVGDGEEKGVLQRLVRASPFANDVEFLGYRDNPYPYMRAADLFVMSSSWEGFGNVLVEAMCLGTSIVATDCPHGPREILEDGRLGRLVPVDQAPALSAAMQQALDAPTPPERLRAAAVRFDSERIARAYLDTMGFALDSQSAAPGTR